MQVTSPVDFAAGRTDKPAIERQNPTKVYIYNNSSGIDVVLDPSIVLNQKMVTVPSTTGKTGATMDMWNSQKMTEDAITYAAAQVKQLAKGAPVSVNCPEQYKAAFKAAYSKS